MSGRDGEKERFRFCFLYMQIFIFRTIRQDNNLIELRTEALD